MVDPATLPDILPPASKRSGKKKDEEEEEERKIDLSEIIGLPDFDVCPSFFTLLIPRLPPFLGPSLNAGWLRGLRGDIS